MKRGAPIMLSLLLFLMGSPLTAESIRVGAIFAATGDATLSNQEHLPGLYLAVAEINSSGGLLGREVGIVEYDSGSTSYGAQRAAEQAVRDGVVAVIGSVWSSHSLAAAKVLQPAGIPMIAPSSTNPDVTRTGDYIFRVCYIDSFQGAVMADFAYADLGLRKAAIMTNTARLYSIDLSEVFADHFAGLGGEIVLTGEYVNNATDFTGLLEQVRHSDAEMVFLPSNSGEAIVVLRQARGMGVNLPFLGGDAWTFVMSRYSGPKLEDAYYCDHWHIDMPGDRNRRFVQRHLATYGPIDNSGAPLTYDAMMLLADAITRAGSADRQSVRRALAETEDFPGVTGSISMDEWGNPMKSVVIVSLSAGRSVLVRTIDH